MPSLSPPVSINFKAAESGHGVDKISSTSGVGRKLIVMSCATSRSFSLAVDVRVSYIRQVDTRPRSEVRPHFPDQRIESESRYLSGTIRRLHVVSSNVPEDEIQQ